MNTKTAAYYMSVAQHPFDDSGPGRLLTGVAIAYAIIVIGLAAKLVFSSGTPGWAAPVPFGFPSTSIADRCTSTASQVPESGDPDGAERNHAGANTHAATGE